jgi:hypothetical protein
VITTAPIVAHSAFFANHMVLGRCFFGSLNRRSVFPLAFDANGKDREKADPPGDREDDQPTHELH